MKIEDFIAIVIDNTKSFRDYWLKEHENDPDLWPVEMSEGDWWEQLAAYQPETPDEVYGE